MLNNDIPAGWAPPSAREAVAELQGLTGRRRETATSKLAVRLATRDVPVVVYGYLTTPELLSHRIGCKIYPPFGFGIDLAAMCLDD